MMQRLGRPIAEKNRHEIEKKLATMGDYVKMSYLQRALQSGLDFDTKKYVLIRLSKIYETRNMFIEAGKLIKNAAEINTTYKDKINDYMKAVELYIKGGEYDQTNLIFSQALALANDREKAELKMKRKEFFMTQAKMYLAADKRSPAKVIFEKILTMDLDTEERKQIQRDLLAVYDKLGLVKEYYHLKNSLM